jgi:hypothetical protein
MSRDGIVVDRRACMEHADVGGIVGANWRLPFDRSGEEIRSRLAGILVAEAIFAWIRI